MSERRENVLKPFIEQADYMNERIRSGVEVNRKGTAELRITDAKGKPVPDAHITIEQKTHDFNYGANLFMLDEMETPEKNEAYKKLFADAFNMATLPFYWNDLEPEQGKPRFGKDSPRIYRRPPIDLCLEYCERNGITPKEHCLVYDYFTPDWVKNEVEAAKQAYEIRFRTLAGRYANRIHGWEVINETLCSYGHSALEKEPALIEWAFGLAEKYFPNNELIINEMHSRIWGKVFHGDRSNYYLLIERALNRGARIDTIGMQFHMFYKPEAEAENTAQYYSPENIYAVMDRYADFGKPFQITELTVPAYDYTEDNEQIQAEIITNLYRMWFSHPNMEAIMYWNLVDGYAAYAPQGDMTCGENIYRGGLVRFDLTPKPAYYAVRNLFEKEYRTSVQTGSGDEGQADFRGFYGEYDVTVQAEGRTSTQRIHLSKNDANKFIIII